MEDNRPPPLEIPEAAEPSLVLSREDLFAIKHYVHAWRYLPLDERGVRDYLKLPQNQDYPSIVALVKTLHETLVGHVRTWPRLENASAKLGLQLAAFAQSFIKTGEGVLEAIGNTDAAKSYSSTLEDVAELPLRDNDLGAPQLIGDLLEYMRTQVKSYIADVDKVTELASAFEQPLDEQIHQQIRNVQKGLDELDLVNKSEGLRVRIEELTHQIDIQQEIVEQTNSYALFGWFFGPIGYFTARELVDPSEARAALKALDDQREFARTRMSRLSPFAYTIAEYGTTVSNLKMTVRSAGAAAKRLRKVWEAIGVELTESQRHAHLIDTNTKLMLFASMFKNVLRPWSRTLNATHQLNTRFSDALNEFEKMYPEGEHHV